MKPYFNLSETRNIKRNIAKERIEIGGGDYSIQSDIILPTEITASLEAMAGTPEVFKKTLEDMKKVISGETPIVETVDSTTTPGLDVPKTSKELLLEWQEIENSINELEKKKSNAQRLIGQGFTGEVENDLSALIQQIDEKKELEITARKNYRERYSKERFTSEDAKEALKASGLKETAENIQEMKKHLRKIKTEGIDVGERGMDMLF